MKILNDIISWVYIIGTIVLGLILIVAVSGQFGLRENIEIIVSEQINSPTGLLTGGVLIVLGLLFMNMRIRAERKEKNISFDNPEGQVSISIKAIEDFIERVGEEFSQIVEIKPAISKTREGIRVKAKTILVAGSNVPRIAESIQHTIKNRMQNILGIENVAKIEVSVSKIVSKGGISEETAQQTMDLA